MPKKPSKRPNSARDPRRVVALVYDELCTFEFGIAAEVFGLARPELPCDWYRFSSIAVESGPLRAAGGLAVVPTANASDLDVAGTIIIPGWRSIDSEVPRHLLETLRDAYSGGARILTICSGAFVLAQTGLLDNRSATTHWRYAGQFRARFPRVELLADQLYVDADRLITSAGSAAGIDMLLHVVREDYGTDIVNAVARRLVMHAHRQGGQKQFVEQPVPAAYEANRLAPLLDVIREDLKTEWSVQRIAKTAGMSTRTLQRRFTALTGSSAGQWITSERLARAQHLLENTSLSMQRIAEQTGLGGADNLQYHFRKRLGLSPGDYRRRFRAADVISEV